VKIAVIGAGVAGLAIGWRLKQRGAEVIVLDRAQPGRGATWAAAGMLAASAEAGDARTPDADLAYAARAAWPEFAREIEEASGLGISYAQSGALMIAMTEEEAAHLKAGDDVSILSAGEARALEPMLTSGIRGALWAPKEAQVDNRALGDALAVAFRRAGGTLAANEAVLRIEVESGRAGAVVTPFRRLEADAFVLAAGAWSGLIEGLPAEAVAPVRPVKGEMLALLPPSGAAPLKHIVWGNGVYLVPRKGRLLIGATLEEAGFDTGLTGAAADWLSDRALALMPPLQQWTIGEHWSGLRPASPDGLPLLGQSAVDGLFIASGQHRNGILFAPLVAEILMRSVLERPSDITAFDPRRFGACTVA
jgi:glycine oxidase